MNRFVQVSKWEFKDTETNEMFGVYNISQKRFVDLADEVQMGLNLVFANKIRRGSKYKLSRIEFDSLKSAFAALERSEPHNLLIRDVLKLIDLISSHRDSIEFAS